MSHTASDLTDDILETINEMLRLAVDYDRSDDSDEQQFVASELVRLQVKLNALNDEADDDA